MKITKNGDDYIGFDVSQDEIEVYKDITSTANISCVSLATSTALFPVGDTSKMLAYGSYAGQMFYNTSVAHGKLCIYTGNTWQVPGETIELLNSEILGEGQVLETDTTTNLSCVKVSSTVSTDVIGVLAWQGKASATQGYVTVATHGLWPVGVVTGTYTRGEYLASDSSGWAYEKGTVSNSFGFIMESKTTAADGDLVTALIRSID